MRILHVAHSIEKSYGGPTQSLAGYALAARLAGAGVSVAAPKCSNVDADSLQSRLGDGNLYQFPSYGAGAFTFAPALIRWLKVGARDFDVVHVHGLLNPISSLAARACIARGHLTIIRPYGTLSRYTFSHRRTILKRAYLDGIERPNLVSAAGIHFTTDSELADAAWHGIDFSGRAHIVAPPFLGSPKISPFAAHKGPPTALFLGRLNPIKNLEALIHAWPTVADSFPGARLVIAGDGSRWYRRSLESLASSSRAASGISFAGFVSGSEKDGMLARANVFVLPSHHENFGIAVLEAIAAGVPVVITPQVQLAPFVRENELGVVSTPDYSSLSQAMRLVLGNSLMQKHVAVRGSEVVTREFGMDPIGRRLMAMYAAVSAGSQAVSGAAS